MDERQTTQVTSVTLQGGPPWGFRLFGGNGEPLVLSKVILIKYYNVTLL